jgi:S-formylglutathione hydrolase
VPWGEKAFAAYLGPDRVRWRAYDASALVGQASDPLPLFIDQGLSDKFLSRELRPELLEEACRAARYPLELRRHADYDHSYYFISTFIRDHIEYHARALAAP